MQLGPYEITAVLGAGGMGEVYRARDTRLDRTVAIKVLPGHLSASAEGKQRFEREARTISSLNHPHICVLHDVGNQDGTHYLIMECVEGETLAKRLERGPLPLEDAMKYAVQIADALEAAHSKGIIHRDLKPANVKIFGPRGNTRSCDDVCAERPTGSPAFRGVLRAICFLADSARHGSVMGAV